MLSVFDRLIETKKCFRLVWSFTVLYGLICVCRRKVLTNSSKKYDPHVCLKSPQKEKKTSEMHVQIRLALYVTRFGNIPYNILKFFDVYNCVSIKKN